MPPGTLSIRLAADRDLAAVGQILRDCVAAMRRAGIEQWDDIYPTDAHLAADIDARSLYVASTESGAVVGTVVLNEYQDPEYAAVAWLAHARPLVVHRVMVAPASQGQGIAQRLMVFAEQHARTLGYESIRLDAFTLNPRALRLYERLGYDARGTVRLRKGIFLCFEKLLMAGGRTPV
jgi:GNAT superfamily N-acetyltransferase